MTKSIYFERAIFISWYCAHGDCTFCYMSTQKDKIRDPKKARRTTESILAETLLAKLLNWKIEFISGGVNSFSREELKNLLINIHKIHQQKLWLNLGTLDEPFIKDILPITQGICGTVECINPEVRKKVCPSKPLEPIEYMFNLCNTFNLKKSITIIIGLGESEKDIPLLTEYIKKQKIDQITFYALNPIEGTSFKEGPDKDYFLEWIKQTRHALPKLKIIAGHWVDRIDYITDMLDAGADAITKYPAFKLFGSSKSKELRHNIESSGRQFKSNLTDLPDIDIDKEVDKYNFNDDLAKKIKEKLTIYLTSMQKASKK